jgi:hypothetical protein
MRYRGLLLFSSTLSLCLAFAGAVHAAETLPRVFALHPAAMAAVKARVATGDSRLKPAVDRLRAEADVALKAGPFSVTFGGTIPPSGDKHDYMSVGPYWWPDPKKEDGLPYIRRDGEVNPEYYDHDTIPCGQMADAVETLALAYYLTDHEPYASHAARLLRAWFLDAETRMNPNLQFGQAIPGRCTGRGIGLIDTRTFIEVVDAGGMLAGSKAWTDEDQKALKTWFGEFLDWTLESPYGRDEAATKNNHGTWYDAQVASYALFVGRDDVARRILREAAEKRIASQIEPDGRQPHELARTKSFSYSTMNLHGMFTLATLGDRVGIDLWNFQTADGRSIRKAVDWLAPFASGATDWKHQQISGLHPESLYPLLRRAALAYDEPGYEKRIAEIPKFDPKSERTELLWPAP